MPIEVEMPDLIRGELTVPGGWTARIPKISTGADESAFVRYYIQHGMSIPEAESTVRTSFQALFTRSWLQGLREMILNRAEEYMKMYPDLGLNGFRPERLQAAYVPGENTGRRGKPVVRKILLDLGREEIRRRDTTGIGGE